MRPKSPKPRIPPLGAAVVAGATVVAGTVVAGAAVVAGTVVAGAAVVASPSQPRRPPPNRPPHLGRSHIKQGSNIIIMIFFQLYIRGSSSGSGCSGGGRGRSGGGCHGGAMVGGG